MNTPALLLLFTLGCAASLDLYAGVIAKPAVNAGTLSEEALLTSAQLDQLLAPIALYPDPLIAIILPASTFPTDIVLAARYLKANGDPEAIDDQPWDDSVKALARYPDVVEWMDENLTWTQQMGEVFSLQPAAVLTSTQRLRSAAMKAGHLATTPQQTVVVEREVVRIVPTRREVIYVPVYDPVWVYRPYVVTVARPRPVLTFSIGYRTGAWLSYDCDWGYQTVVVVNQPRRTVVWQTAPIWHTPRRDIGAHCEVWRPAPARVYALRHQYPHRHNHPVRVAQPTVNMHLQRPVEHRERRWDEARGARSAAAPAAHAGGGYSRSSFGTTGSSGLNHSGQETFPPRGPTDPRTTLPRSLPSSAQDRSLPATHLNRALPAASQRSQREPYSNAYAPPAPVFSHPTASPVAPFARTRAQDRFADPGYPRPSTSRGTTGFNEGTQRQEGTRTLARPSAPAPSRATLTPGEFNQPEYNARQTLPPASSRGESRISPSPARPDLGSPNYTRQAGALDRSQAWGRPAMQESAIGQTTEDPTVGHPRRTDRTQRTERSIDRGERTR